MNKIYKIIKEDPELSKDIKVLALALGNKDYEVGVFKKNFRVSYPMFADPKKEVQDESGVESIPLTVLFDKNGKVLMTHLGVVENKDEFIGQIRDFYKKQ